MTNYDASNHYEDNILRIEKFRPQHVWTAVLDDADQGYPYLKRFTFEPSSKKQRFLGDNQKSTLIALSDAPGARFEVKFGGTDSFREPLTVVASEFVAVKSFKAKGKRLTMFEVESITELEPVEIAEDLDEEEAAADQPDEVTQTETEPEKSDDEVRDEINGQKRIF